MTVDLSNLSLITHVLAAARTVTKDELDGVVGGTKPKNPDAYCMTEQRLSLELKVLWVLLQRENVRYREASKDFEKLGPANPKHQAFGASLEAKSRAENMHRFFWSNFLWEYSNLCRGHHEVGFDENFRIWVGSGVRRYADSPSFYQLSQQRFRS